MLMNVQAYLLYCLDLNHHDRLHYMILLETKQNGKHLWRITECLMLILNVK